MQGSAPLDSKNQLTRIRKVHGTPVDVSGVCPMIVAPVRSWFVRLCVSAFKQSSRTPKEDFKMNMPNQSIGVVREVFIERFTLGGSYVFPAIQHGCTIPPIKIANPRRPTRFGFVTPTIPPPARWDCGSDGCGCHGGADCLDMILSPATDNCCAFFCNQEADGQPSCWCSFDC
jgi:hypothetical protein